MKKIFTTVVAVFAIFQFSFGQNTSWSTTSNIGIGTQTPSSNINLQVEKTSSQPAIMIGGGYAGSPRLQIYGLNSDPNGWMGLGTDMAGGPYEHSVYFPTAPSGYNSKLTIGDYNGTSYNPRMTVLNNGNVGIGTLNPGSNLTIKGNNTGVSIHAIGSGYYGTLAFNRESATGAIFNPSGNAFQINNGGPDANLHFQVYNGSGSNITGDALVISGSNGSVGVNTADTHGFQFAVNGNAIATSMTVKLYANWPDFVFKKGYKLPPLTAIKTFIDKYQHLPDMPSEAEVIKNGINLGEMVKLQTKKIEELTLYAIQQKEENQKLKEEQQKRTQEQDARIKVLETTILKLSKKINNNLNKL
jgi:hypothetical protein